MKRILLHLLLVFLPCLAIAQSTMPPFQGTPLGEAQKSELQNVERVGVIDPASRGSETKWMKSIQRLTSYSHGAPTEVQKRKEEWSRTKPLAEMPADQTTSSTRAANPVVGTNFLGNSLSQATPTDNCLAISNAGRIISSDNSTIAFYNQNGSGLMVNETHDDWFDDVAASLYLPSSLFDPRVIYDPVEDRFIFVILHGSSAATSKVIVCFSQTNNPAGAWNVYEFSGNPLNDNSWFDYPNIGISANDLFITGNLFFTGSGSNQTIVYQIDKHAGYSGQSLDYLLYNNIPGGSVGSFTLVPASHGQGSEYGPGIYMVNSHWYSNNRLNLYEVTNDVHNSPSLLYNANFAVQSYEVPGDAYQLGHSELLNTNDTRMQHAFYLNGIVHAVHQVNYQSGYSGIAYYRIPVENPSGTISERFGQFGVDYAFPSIASFGLEEIDQAVVIGFLYSSSNDYPGMRVVNCDNHMVWSDAVTVRAGNSYINHSYVNGVERWGDYSDMQRRHNANDMEVWFGGCFGPQSHVWNTWIAEINGTYEPAPLPVADFGSDTNAGYDAITIQFGDSSTNDPQSWKWTFEGGNPATSAYQFPSVNYNDTGWFDVKLVVSNQFGSDSMLQENYIHVLSSDTHPIAPEGIAANRAEGLDVNVYPNPSAAFELVHVDIDNPTWAPVVVNVFDLHGSLVKELYRDEMRPGLYRLSFNKFALPAGQYLIQIERNGAIVQTERIINY